MANLGFDDVMHTHTHTHTLPGWADLDFTEARDSEWQWHQLGHMQVCTLLQTDNYASTPPLSFLQARCPSLQLPPRYVTGEKLHRRNDAWISVQWISCRQSVYVEIAVTKLLKIPGSHTRNTYTVFVIPEAVICGFFILCLNERNHVLIYLCRSFRNLLPIMQKCSTKLCCSAMLFVGHWTCDS